MRVSSAAIRAAAERASRLAGTRQHLFDVLGELGAELRVLLVGRKVVVTVGHGEPVLVERAEIDGRILAVGTREPGERLRNADALRVADVTRHVARRGDRVDARQFVLERRDPEAFRARGVHVGEVEVADFLRIRTRGPIRQGGRHDDELLHLFPSLIIENAERAVIGAIRRYLGFGEPATPCEAIQIVLRTNAAVETCEIEAGLELRFRGNHRRRCGSRGLWRRGSTRRQGGCGRQSDKSIDHGDPRKNGFEGTEYKKSPKLLGPGA